jgi:NADH-quinone oxidoreductase subunit G
MAVNAIDYDFNFALAENIVVPPSRMVTELAAIARAAGCQDAGVQKLIDAATVEDRHTAIAEKLQSAEQGIILLGNYAASHPDYTLIRALASALAEKTNVAFGTIPQAGNSTGAWLAGVLPHRMPAGVKTDKPGLDTSAMFEQQQSVYLLLDIEPAMDFANPVKAMEKLATAKTVALTSFSSESLLQTADILLPVGSFAETSGTYVNAQSDWQGFAGAMPALGDARPAWKVLRVLGNMTNQPGFEYVSSQEIGDELKAGFVPAPGNQLAAQTTGDPSLQPGSLERVADVPMYSSDSIVRRSRALQHTADAWKTAIRMNSSTAASAGLSAGDQAVLSCVEGEMTMAEVIIDGRVIDGTVWYPAAVPGSEKLSRLFGEVTLTKG